MAKKTPFQTACATLGMLTEDELFELVRLIDELLYILEPSPESDIGGDEKDTQPGGRGHIELKMIRGFGPYAYLRRWKGKTLTSTYLGKARTEG